MKKLILLCLLVGATPALAAVDFTQTNPGANKIHDTFIPDGITRDSELSSALTGYQATDADLDIWATITPSANSQTMLPLDYAGWRTSLGVYSDSETDSAISTAIAPKANTTDVLELDNTTIFIPSADYHPATKKYVDDNIGTGAGIPDVGSYTERGTLALSDIFLVEDTGGTIYKITLENLGLYWDNSYQSVLGNEAGLYSALSDVTQFFEPGDTIQTGAATTLPGTCADGDLYVDTDADTDGELYLCAGSSWKAVDDDGGTTTIDDVAVSAAWDGDTDGTSKNSIRDYLVLIDTDLDGDLADEDFAFTGNIDLTTANSVNMGPIKLADSASIPSSVGEFRYNNTVTGLDDGALQWYDDDEVQVVVSLDSSEIFEAADDGKVVTFNWNAGAGYWNLSAATGGSAPEDTALDGTWDADTAATSKNTIHDYVVQFDADLDGLLSGFELDSINSTHLAADAVTLDAMADNSVGSAQLITGSVGSSELSTGAVTVFDLGADAVNGDKIIDDAVDSEHIVDGAVDAVHISTIVESIAWNAAGTNSDGTNCADPAEVTINSGPITYTTICADNDASTIYGHVVMPDSWDGGTVTMTSEYIQTAADTNALNGDIAMMCRGSGETVNNTWGAEVAIDDAAVTGSNAVDQTTSGAVTPNGTCAGGDTLFWRYQMDATGTTTAVATLHLVGWVLEYTSNVGD